MADTVRNIVLTGQDRGASAAVRSVESALSRAQQVIERYKASAVSVATPLNNLQASATRSASAVSAMSSAMNNARTRVGAASGSMTQLSFQINDIASGLLMGQSPFQIMAQQGGQVFQIWQMNNNIFRDLKDTIVSLGARAYAALGPVGIAGAAIAAAGGVAYYLYTVNRESETATDHLDQQKDAINAIKAAFDNAAGSAKKLGADTQNVAIALANVARVKILADLNKQISDLQKSLPPTTQRITDAYRRALPGLPGLTQNFPKQSTGPQGAFEQAIDLYNKSTASPAARVRDFAEAVAEVVNRSKDPAIIKFGGQLLKNAEDARNSVKALNELDQAIANPGATANKTSNSFAELIRRTKDQIAEFRAEAESAGQSGQAVDALKKKHELIRAAIKDGIPVQQALTRARREGADADTYAAAKAEIRLAKLKADLQFEREQLGRTPQEQAVNSQLRQAGIDPLSAIGAQTAAELRFNETLRETRDLAKSALSTFVGDLRQGKSATDALRNSLDRVADKLIDMATNQLIASLFGGGGKSGGGLFGNMFGQPLFSFGGPRAAGGPVDAGKAYVVGEHRPELFVPGRSGTIIPRVGGGGPNITIAPVIQVQGGAGKGDQEQANMIAGSVVREINSLVDRRLMTQLRPGGILDSSR